MIKRKHSRYDQLWVGWLIGTIFPLLIFMLTYQLKYNEMDFQVFLQSMWDMKILMKLLSICVFPNLAFFFLFYNLKYDMAARGVIVATFIYAFVVLIAKVM